MHENTRKKEIKFRVFSRFSRAKNLKYLEKSMTCKFKVSPFVKVELK
jgi:hypothetical protein